MDDLQKFVNVALHTSAGEGDFSSDRLSNLKIVGSGYGPLIYKLQEGSSFDTFRSLCEEVWKSLIQAPKLPTLLVSFLLSIASYFFIYSTFFLNLLYCSLPSSLSMMLN